LPFRLTRGQLTFLLHWYSLDRDGQWRFDHAARRLAKGSGKSPFAAVLALIEFCAPVRLARFDDRELGGVRGRAVDMPLVQIAATAESQTVNTMRYVRAFAPKGSAVAKEYELDPGKTKYYKLPEGTLEIITSSATAAEGAESTFVIADETEHWKPSNGGPELAATLGDNLAKSGSRMLETSNAWCPGLDTVAEATWDDWLAQEEGRSRREARILYDARIARPETDMADPDSLRAELEHVYADCDWKRDENDALNVRPIMQRIWKASSKSDDSQRKYLNQPTADLNAWVTSEDWNKLAIRDALAVDSAVDEIGLFFDGSKSRDATALVGVVIGGERDGNVFTLGDALTGIAGRSVWEPNPRDPNDIVDAGDVDRVVDRAFQAFKGRVLAFFADVREWESFVLTDWPRRFGPELLILATPSARPQQPIAWDMRGHGYDFAKAAEACEAEIRDVGFRHDDHPAVARHIANCRRKAYRDAVTVGKESKDSPLKIDAAVCVIGARMVRRIVMASPAYLKRRRGGKFMGARW
jgi:hypothetical protein